MELMYENILNHLLIESKVDTFSRLITKKIVQVIIERIEKLNVKKKLTIGIKNLKSTSDEFTVKLTVILKKGSKNQVNTAGSWIPALDMLEVNVFFETSSGVFEKTLLQKLHTRLYDTIRHEVEHSLQVKPDDMYSDVEFDDEQSLWHDLGRLEDYFLSSEEISAFVSGLYHQAKRVNRPFINVVDDKLSAYNDIALYYGGDQDEISDLFKRVRNEWIKYAKQRFPKAIVQ